MLHLKDLSSLYPLQDQRLRPHTNLLILNDLSYTEAKWLRPESRVLQVLRLKGLASRWLNNEHDKKNSCAAVQ